MLLDMGGAMTNSRRGGGRTPDIISAFTGWQQALKAMLDLIPGPLILRLFLTPDNLLDMGIGFECLDKRRFGEGIELLDAQ